jgi:hypothetical protein
MMGSTYATSGNPYSMGEASYAMATDPSSMMEESYAMPSAPYNINSAYYPMFGNPYGMNWNSAATAGLAQNMMEDSAELTGSNYAEGYPSSRQMYENPYIFRATVESPAEMAYPSGALYGTTNYPSVPQGCPCERGRFASTQLPCSQCRSSLQVKTDAMGDPRYVYDAGANDYFFITPDGEMISRS